MVNSLIDIETILIYIDAIIWWNLTCWLFRLKLSLWSTVCLLRSFVNIQFLYVGTRLSASSTCITFRATVCPPCYECRPIGARVQCHLLCSATENKRCVVEDNTNSSEPWQTTCRLDFNNTIAVGLCRYNTLNPHTREFFSPKGRK